MTEQKAKKEIELLAPAGSFETFQAVIRAGADAVYLGGSRFGARAYADNFGEEELLRAIDYAHIHGREVYLTINTLFKEEELCGQLYDYLLPYYQQGLDAVIVQDLGALSVIRREFPGLYIHTSTQMTVTGTYGAAYMKALGASRVVTAREMSLAEIHRIHDEVGIEIESFVHGALCYCYSGQCLLSSMLGGRSGNRGRCAQPCRLPYEVFDDAGRGVPLQGNSVLSPKDLCTVSAIPELAECGIYSFKIEGRMKQAEYAAGVVSVYRSYIDRYLSSLSAARNGGRDEREARALAKERFHVSETDIKKLLDMGNRSGFTDGYYHRRNGSDMITFGKPNHAKTNEHLQSEIREKYVHAKAEGAEIKEKINGILKLKKDFPATIELRCGAHVITCEGAIVQPALKQPLSRERVEADIKKTGNTPFSFEKLSIELDEDIFLPVQALKQLRREALAVLEKAVLEPFRRMPRVQEKGQETLACVSKREREAAPYPNRNIAVSIEDRRLRQTVLERDFVNDIYYDSSAYDREKLFAELAEDVSAAHRAGKRAYYILPAVFRSLTADFYREHLDELMALAPDGIVVKSLDAAAFVRAHVKAQLPIILDHSIYSWNTQAKELLEELSPLRDTVPLELNRRELYARDNSGSEIVIYGNLPLMTSAQCVHANTGKCDRRKTLTYLKDRYGKCFPVKNNCTECYNTVYNTVPLMLFDYRQDFCDMGMAGYRLAFTVEQREEAQQVLSACEDTFLSGKRSAKEAFCGEYTNGHYKRGVE